MEVMIMNDRLVPRIRELTDVDFERDSAVTERAQLRSLLTQFMENDARSCSMDFGCITPLYVYRMWGGNTSLEEIEEAMAEIKVTQGPRHLYSLNQSSV
jgi:hypothetical protein